MAAPYRGGGVHLDPPGPAPEGLGRFGEFGGRYVPETLVFALEQLEAEFRKAWYSEDFRAELGGLLASYAGRPTPITECHNLSELFGVRVLLKREDLTHTGSHKINNVLGQALLAKRMGKQKVIAETGAGQHGVATATAAALFGLECKVFMGAVDVERQALNVWRMRLLGAEVVPVTSGSGTLKDAINDAMRDWVASVEDTYYCIGSVVGPHPYPWIVREFQRVVGDEAREQARAVLGGDPDFVVACVGGGSNAMGTFAGFLNTKSRLIGVEAAGLGLESGQHGASLSRGVPGVLHGARSQYLQDEEGQILEAHSISAGLDYPGVGPEHASLSADGRAEYVSATDEEALAGFKLLSVTEGIVPALEPAHAVGWLAREAGKMIPKGSSVVLTMSGRGDKDAQQVSELLDLSKD
ncbi:MAG: tryptophan synthase subunit beta [Actinobacteria bacterium]|uniref:tryptophan synthase n=2 Tax=freshwater metagenome TaxID=449393 RepID=A0A6J6X282_9ZZZZ|nr:tryptophan synthase subunit beta [Actinomycetota bacterium]MSX32715.1 tryptophan synthase subunit beta [Actinomycetota bacterium]MSX81462.1 tryptophan synthase subunit beta [Actinomycetota bacterium]